MRWIIGFLSLCSFCLANPMLEELISPKQIEEKIVAVASELNALYGSEELTLILVMKGSICVGSDLMRALKMPVNLVCITASSYGMNGTKRGELVIKGMDGLELEGKNVLVVDDIFDTGHTMQSIIQKLSLLHPKSLKSLVLLLKDIPRSIAFRPDYALFPIDDLFVVGYGLDYKELYRNLPGVCILK